MRHDKLKDYIVSFQIHCDFIFFRGGKLESATGTYVRRQAVVFFSGILESSVEFRKAFCASRAASEDDADDFKMSSLLVWVREEMTRHSLYLRTGSS